MTNIDTNIDNYTIAELLLILVIYTPTSDNVDKATNAYISRFEAENNDKMVNFFSDMQNKLEQYVDDLETSDDPAEMQGAKEQTTNWWANQALKQSSQVQNDKITERVQKIDVYNDNHLPMKREQLGVNNVKSVDVAQDSLNPTLKNINQRLVVIDSQFRSSISPSSSIFSSSSSFSTSSFSAISVGCSALPMIFSGSVP